MNVRERFQAVMNFQPFDRLPLVEWATWWDKTLERWHGEHLPADVTDKYDVCSHFGLELYFQDWISGIGPECPEPARHGAGILTSMDEYERMRPRLYPWPVVDRDRWARWGEMQSQGRAVLWYTMDGFFWFARMLLGIERHLYAFYDQPELMHRINADLTEFHLRELDEICSIVRPDFMTFAEDMSYNHGSMLSKELFDGFMRPYYDRVIPRIRECGAIAVIDSDGDVTVPAGWFGAAGIEGILPLERQAGVDVAVLRQMHPRMRFIGCFDKMTMTRGEQAMRAEFERLVPTAAKGGLIISCDHQTPPGVSYDVYQLYLRLFREYAEQAGHLSRGE